MSVAICPQLIREPEAFILRNLTSDRLYVWRSSSVNVALSCAGTGGEAGNLHPGLWKLSPRLLGNPTQGWVHPRLGPPRLLENPTQGSGKLQNLHKPCDYTFLDKQVSEEKIEKMTTPCRAKSNYLYVHAKKIQFIY